MNILPLVFTFLIIFSCLCLTFFREMKSFFLVETAIGGYRRTERVVDNAAARKNYRRIKTEPVQKNQPQEKISKKMEYVSRRTLMPPLESSKFYLKPLAKDDTEFKTHPLYEPLANLLRVLYQKNLFSKPNTPGRVEYLLLDAIVKKIRKYPDAELLSDLCPDDPRLKAIYYKMLKGTNQYSPEKGIPPFSDFFSMEKSGKSISLSFASPPLLEALFGQEIALEILSNERKNSESSNKYYYISKEDLQNLLFKNPSTASLLPAIEPYLDHSKQLKPRNSLHGRDQITGIGLEKSL